MQLRIKKAKQSNWVNSCASCTKTTSLGAQRITSLKLSVPRQLAGHSNSMSCLSKLTWWSGCLSQRLKSWSTSSSFRTKTCRKLSSNGKLRMLSSFWATSKSCVCILNYWHRRVSRSEATWGLHHQKNRQFCRHSRICKKSSPKFRGRSALAARTRQKTRRLSRCAKRWLEPRAPRPNLTFKESCLTCLKVKSMMILT